MVDHVIKANDLLPVIEATLGFLDAPSADSELATKLADVGTTVSFIMKKTTDAVAPTVNSAAEITDAPTRTVRYVWTGTDTAEPGEYNAEWEVTGSDGKPQTFPTSGYTTITIEPDLDAEA